MKNKTNGITLIALVITIIVLLILAGVSIAMLTGENGILSQAQKAKNSTEQAALEEQDALNSLMDEMTNIISEEQTPIPIEKIAKGEIFEETTKIEDATDDIFYVPGGFGIDEESANEVDEGIVISNADDTKQFVWIPVNDESLSNMYVFSEKSIQLSGQDLGVEAKTNMYSNLRVENAEEPESFITGTPNSASLREPDILPSTKSGDAVNGESDSGIEQIKNVLEIEGDSSEEVLNNYAKNLVEEYKSVYESTKKYKGFYIGRYEITGNVENPTVQKEETVLSNVNYYRLKKACLNIVSSKYAQSTMIYGNQWDEVMSWLVKTGEKTYEEVNIDSSSWGNCGTGNKTLSGYNELWKSNNIYDLSGNCLEITQETFSDGAHITRGGQYRNISQIQYASERGSIWPSYYIEYISTRAILYVK